MTQREETLKKIFSDIHFPEPEDPDTESEAREVLGESAVDFLEALGYKPENLFMNVQLETPRRVRFELGWRVIPFEVIAARRVTAPPHLALKTRLSSEKSTDPPYGGQLAEWDSQLLGACSITSQAEYTVVLTNTYIAISPKFESFEVYPYSELGEEQIDKLIDELSPPEDYPEGLSDRFPPGYHPNQTKLTRWLFPDSEITPEYRSAISGEHFELDIDEYAERLYEAYTANSNVEKGNSLEDVVEFLFEGLDLVRIRDRNLRTRTGEIDFVLEYNDSSIQNLFQYHSRYILIECKNMGESVSTKEVAHFEKKLIKSNISLGILVAWNGISGEETGDYAQRYVDSDTPEDTTILVIDSRDLYRILDGLSLYELIDEKLYALRFDL